jgi:hypothetical protein
VTLCEPWCALVCCRMCQAQLCACACARVYGSVWFRSHSMVFHCSETQQRKYGDPTECDRCHKMRAFARGTKSKKKVRLISSVVV